MNDEVRQLALSTRNASAQAAGMPHFAAIGAHHKRELTVPQLLDTG